MIRSSKKWQTGLEITVRLKRRYKTEIRVKARAIADIRRVIAKV